MKLGILGGTFNPIHLGHITIATEVKSLFNLDSILFIPAKSPPLKETGSHFSDSFRYKLVEAAIKEQDCFQVSDIEFQREGPSYTVRTLKEVLTQTKIMPQDLYFVLGIDGFYDIKLWNSYRELFNLANFIIVTRAGVETDLQKIITIAQELGFCYNGDIEGTVNFCDFKEKKYGTENESSEKSSQSETTGVSNAYALPETPNTNKNSENFQICRSLILQGHHNISKQGNLPRMLKNFYNNSDLHIFLVEVSPIDISSTDIRNRLNDGRSIEDLVPRAVHNLIKEEYTTT